MPAWLPAVGSGLAALGGMGASLGSSALGYALSSKEAKRNRRFQERMSRNRYTYMREDLERAGYNPILGLRQGPGSPPAGAMAQVPDFGRSPLAGAQAALTTAQAANERKRGQLLDLEIQEKRPKAALGDMGGELLSTVRPFIADAADVLKAYDSATTSAELDQAEAKAKALKERVGKVIRGTVYEFAVPPTTKWAIEYLRKFWRQATEDAEIFEQQERADKQRNTGGRRSQGRGDRDLVITPR